MEQVEITSEEFRNWTEDKITKAVVKEVIDIRNSLTDTLASGYTISKDSDVTTDRLVGRIEGITELFNLFMDTKDKLKEKPDYGH
ncbi:MAG: hypothetical protein KJO69_06545 [Gammaproteobacteria bacterium]|nr:hypothetical protein [Gammaproteobacteria bacterium]